MTSRLAVAILVVTAVAGLGTLPASAVYVSNSISGTATFLPNWTYFGSTRYTGYPGDSVTVTLNSISSSAADAVVFRLYSCTSHTFLGNYAFLYVGQSGTLTKNVACFRIAAQSNSAQAAAGFTGTIRYNV